MKVINEGSNQYTETVHQQEKKLNSRLRDLHTLYRKHDAHITYLGEQYINFTREINELLLPGKGKINEHMINEIELRLASCLENRQQVLTFLEQTSIEIISTRRELLTMTIGFTTERNKGM